MPRLRSLVLPAVVVAVALAAVIVAGGAAAGPTVTIGVHWSRFVPREVSVPVGVPVTFLLRNDDPIEHEWIVGDAALHERHRTGTEPAHHVRPTEQSMPALTTIETRVTFDHPGRYLYICHLPGHEAYGMVGVVTVTASP